MINIKFIYNKEIKDTLRKFIQIILSPQSAWGKHDFSNLNLQQVIFPFLAVTLLFTFVCRILGNILYYLSFTGIEYILMHSFIMLIVDSLYFAISLTVIHRILPFYGNNISRSKILILLLLSLVPFYISTSITSLFNSLFFITIISFYGLYILYWGLKSLIKIDDDKLNIFFVTSLIIMAGVYAILYFVIIYPFFDLISK